jgi:signal peptidase I
MNEPVENPTEAPPAPTPERKAGSFFKDMLETLGLALVLFLAINLISARVRVDGFSMLPTLENNQYVLISRLKPRFGDLQRGDIIVFRPPMYPSAGWLETVLGFPIVPGQIEDYIKRVIGLPGETVTIGGGQVSIDGVLLEEPYISEAPSYTGSWTVPEGFLFVLGDNRNNSSDSHSWGFVPAENVLGKAVLVYWPFSDWKVLDHNQAVMAAPAVEP